jgi:hypothetical protein
MRRHYSKDGEKLYKIVRVKVFMPGNGHCERHLFKPKPGTGFTAEGVDDILRAISDKLEERLPGHEYELVELANNGFNFIWKGKTAEAVATPIASQDGVHTFAAEDEGKVAVVPSLAIPEALQAVNEMASGVGSNLDGGAR